MSTGFKEALEREIADLEKSLEADPRFIKLRELQRVAGLYNPGGSVSETPKSNFFVYHMQSPKRHAAAVVVGVKPPAFSEGSDVAVHGTDGLRRLQAISRQRALEDAENILRGRTEPTKTADLYDDLVAAGHEIGGDDPRNNLSAMLSKSPLFRSHKRAGWTLVESQSTAPDDDGPDDQQDTNQEQGISADDLLG